MTAPPPPPALDVALRRRVHAGLAIDVRLRLGAELGVLFGRSGSGKTSILRMIAGLSLPDAGSVHVGGQTLFDSEQRLNRRLSARRIGFVMQHDLLFPHRDVAGNVGFGLRGQSRPAIAARVAAVARLCGIDHLLDRPVGTLSGGERQRVGLARAIAPRPRLLLCDEPVSALDLDARYRLLFQLRQVQQAESIPVLLVTHAAAEALAFGDHLWLLDAGQVQAEGLPHQILSELSARGLLASTDLQNVHGGVVSHHDPATHATTVQLAGGPALVAAAVAAPVGARVLVRVDSEQVVLATGDPGPLSARNQLAGTIDQLIPHETRAEVIVRTHDLRWVVGVLAATVQALDLRVGNPVTLIIKARSCHVLPALGAE